MAKVSFYLTEPGADKPTPIFAFVSFDGKRVKVYTGLSIHPAYWLKGEQVARTRGYADGGAVNDTLKLLGERLATCYLNCRATGRNPTAAELRAVAEPEPEAAAPEAAPAAFSAVYSEWIEGRKGVRSANTLRTYRTTLRHLTDFQQLKGYAVDFDTITAGFFEQFTGYLMRERSLNDSAVRKNVAILKHFLSYATERGLTNNLEYKRFTWKHREPDILTLTRLELRALESLDLAGRPALDNARALFLLGCYTGLRFSDVAGLRPENILPDRLRLTTQKTRDTLTIPLRPEARPILDRLLSGNLRPITNQKLNGHLKTLGQLAGLATSVEKVRYRGGNRLSETFAKYELLTTHTARRTFVTLALETGVRPEVVMKATGHKSWQTFRRYVNVTEDAVLKEFGAAFGTTDAPIMKAG